MTTLMLNNGPVFVARRKPGGSWEINDQGFPTVEAAQAHIATLPKDYEYSWADTSDMMPIAVTRATNTKQ